MPAERPHPHALRALGPLALVVTLLGAAGVARARSPLPQALARFEAGEYLEAVKLLGSVATIDRIPDLAERAQALRVYGISSRLLDHDGDAETAFLHWLDVEPGARLDRNLVRPEVVDFFDGVLARNRDQLLRKVERKRPRTPILNLLPPAGQFQNGQYLKFGILLGSELLLAGLSIGTYVALGRLQHPDGQVDDEGQWNVLRAGNWVSFGCLLGIVTYAVIDGFVFHARRLREIEREEDSLRADAPRLRAAAGGFAIRF